MKAIKSTGDVLDYRYDGDGLLIEKIKNGTGVANNFQITGGQHTKYVTSATEEIAQLDEGRNIIQRYIPGPAIDERVAQVDANGAVKYIHTDKQNSVIALSDSSGNVISRRNYGSYGETSTTQMNDAVAHPFGYTERRWDAVCCRAMGGGGFRGTLCNARNS